MKYENIDLPEFPSKYQIFNKVESRKEKFQKILEKIIILASLHENITESLLSILFKFLSKNGMK